MEASQSLVLREGLLIGFIAPYLKWVQVQETGWLR